MSEPDSPKVQQVHQYTSHNFDSMNRAIDNEVQKQEMWTALYRNHRMEKGSRIVFNVLTTLCVLALTATIIWWLMFPANPQYHLREGVVGNVAILGAEAGLEEISKSETVEGSEAPFINTTFTVFHRALTPSGEEVVTGKTYEPGSLAFPVEQYCYLESRGKNNSLQAKPLAIFDAGEIILETKAQGLIEYAEVYCRFSI